MQLDVLFYEELTKNSGFASELNYSNIHDELENFSNIDGVSRIITVFRELIESVYKVKYSNKKILGWINGLHRMFEIAEGDHPKFYRNLKANSFTYRNRADIDWERAVILRKPKDRDVNFLHVEEIDFFKDCIPQYYHRFVLVAKKAYDFIYEEGQELNENDIPPINLDTGRLLPANNLDLIPEFWQNKN